VNGGVAEMLFWWSSCVLLDNCAVTGKKKQSQWSKIAKLCWVIMLGYYYDDTNVMGCVCKVSLAQGFFIFFVTGYW